MGAATADVIEPFDNGHAGALFHQSHRGTFAARARANNYGVKLIVLLHVGGTYSYTKLQRYLNIIAPLTQSPLGFLRQSATESRYHGRWARLYKCCCNKICYIASLTALD
ncbi:hypothetical protein AXX16_0693 [Serratia rubidaea]|nr:hypothetical protein AXX16_0693 [Serratia rubidaea]